MQPPVPIPEPAAESEPVQPEYVAEVEPDVAYETAAEAAPAEEAFVEEAPAPALPVFAATPAPTPAPIPSRASFSYEKPKVPESACYARESE